MQLCCLHASAVLWKVLGSLSVALSVVSPGLNHLYAHVCGYIIVTGVAGSATLAAVLHAYMLTCSSLLS